MGLYYFSIAFIDCHVTVALFPNIYQCKSFLYRHKKMSTQAAWALLMSFLASGSMDVPATSALALALDRSC